VGMATDIAAAAHALIQAVRSGQEGRADARS